MSSLVSRFLTSFSPKFKSRASETRYQQLQARSQNRILLFLRPLITGFLISLTIFSRVNSLTFYDHFSKASHLIAALAVLSIPTPWPIFQNTIFAFLLWLVQLFVSSEIRQQDEKALVFFLGYALGAIEVIMIFSIKNVNYRLAAQAVLALTKILNFSYEIRMDPRILIIVIGIALISLILFIYHDILERNNFKDYSNSREELAKFQKILTDDFPISVIITPVGLSSIFYNNKSFVQNFLQGSHFLGMNEPIEALFKKILLEFDEINQQTSHCHTKISLYTFITQTMNSHFYSRDVINLYSLFQYGRATQHHYEIKVRKIAWENNPAYIIIFNDVSEKQKVTVLQEADRQRDRVIATITHELKTPINGILGLLDIISTHTQDSISKTYVEHCKNCSKLLLYQVNSIMDLCQLRDDRLKVEKTMFSLNEFLKEIKSLYTFVSEHRGLEFIVEKEKEVPISVYTDKYRLINILVQLLGNAMKFTFKGFVKLRVEMNLKNPQKLTFIVEDSGIGIKQEEDKIKLFNMFGQITSKKKNINHHGAGLGITIANELVGILNNPLKKREHITCKSEFGKGSKFKFRIDSIPDDAAKSRYLTGVDSFAENTRAEREIGSDLLSSSIKALERNILIKRQGLNVTSKEGGLQSQCISIIAEKRVLIVDDNPLNLVAASFIVSKLGLQASTAANGSEAIKMLQESFALGQHYSFVLMDIQMPIMDGIQATKIISQMMQTRDLYKISIIALTAKKIDDQEKKIYKDCGMIGALGKPLIEQELIDMLKQLP